MRLIKLYGNINFFEFEFEFERKVFESDKFQKMTHVKKFYSFFLTNVSWQIILGRNTVKIFLYYIIKLDSIVIN